MLSLHRLQKTKNYETNPAKSIRLCRLTFELLVGMRPIPSGSGPARELIVFTSPLSIVCGVACWLLRSVRQAPYEEHQLAHPDVPAIRVLILSVELRRISVAI